MRKFLILLSLIALAGCATVTTAPTGKPLTHVREITVGMSKAEVTGTMGKEAVIGYEQNSSGMFVPVTIKNPVKVERLKIAGRSVDVFYYFTRINQADGKITDDELTPLVFENDHLIGQGWDYFNKLKTTASP